jgi:hypothetical protein
MLLYHRAYAIQDVAQGALAQPYGDGWCLDFNGNRGTSSSSTNSNNNQMWGSSGYDTREQTMMARHSLQVC